MAGEEHPIRAHEDEFKRINKRLETAEDIIDKIRTDGNDRLKEVEFKVDEYGKRLDKEEKQTEAMLKIAYSVETMSGTLETVVTKLDNHDKALNVIQNKAGQIALKGWVFVATIIGTAIVTGLIGLVIGTLADSKL